jgi:hypothetical protein
MASPSQEAKAKAPRRSHPNLGGFRGASVGMRDEKKTAHWGQDSCRWLAGSTKHDSALIKTIVSVGQHLLIVVVALI